MANDWLSLDAQLPWLERQSREQQNLSSQVLNAMQFGARLQQQKFENNLHLMDFGLRAQAQELQNKSTLLRIQEAQNSLNDDEADHPVMASFLDDIRNENDLDSLRSMGVPSFKSTRNLAVANSALTQRINQLSGIAAERMLTDTRAYNLKRLDALDPDLRQEVLPYLNPKTGLFEEGSNEVWQQMEDEQQQRNREAKLAEEAGKQDLLEKRMVAVEKVKNLYRAGIRGATSITDKAKLSAFNNELHAITFDPLLSTEEKAARQKATMEKYGVIPSFAEGDVMAGAAPTTEQEASLYDTEIKGIQNQIDTLKVDLAKSPKKALLDFGKDNRLIKIQDLEEQKSRLEAVKKGEVTAPKTVNSQEQFDALPSGAIYIGTDGRKYRKP